MNCPKKKNKKFVQAISVVILASSMLLFTPQKAAASWIPIDPIIRTMLDIVQKQIVGIVMAAAKQAAVKMVNGQLDVQMGGQNGNVAFVANWRSWLVDEPRKNTEIIINDNLSKMLGGRGNSLSYSSEGFSGTGNYANSLSQMEKAAINQENALPKMTYEGDPSQMFASGNFENMSLYFSGVNNPWSFNISVQSQYNKELQTQMLMKQQIAGAYSGFKGTIGSDGNVTYPGSLTKEMAANIQNIPNIVIASANSIPEVITSAVTQMMTKMTQQGFSSVQNNSQKNSNTQNKLSNGINNYIDANGPGSIFTGGGGTFGGVGASGSFGVGISGALGGSGTDGGFGGFGF